MEYPKTINQWNEIFEQFNKILTAKIPYKNGNWDNTDIHDTHLKSTGRDIICPFDFPDYDIYLPKIKDCLLHISKFLVGKISIYSQTQKAFEIFGCDVRIKDENNIIVREINDKVEYTLNTTESAIKLSDLFFNAIINNIFNPILNNKPIETIDWLYCKKI